MGVPCSLFKNEYRISINEVRITNFTSLPQSSPLSGGTKGGLKSGLIFSPSKSCDYRLVMPGVPCIPDPGSPDQKSPASSF